jgi:IS605 OrfB family transposase
VSSSRKKYEAQAEQGDASICFGSRHMMTSRHELDRQHERALVNAKNDLSKMRAADAAHDLRVSHWRKRWEESRVGSWLFTGAASVASANSLAKYDPSSATLSVRLLPHQQKRRLEAKAALLGLKVDDLLDKSLPYGTLLQETAFLDLKVPFKGKGESGKASQSTRQLALSEALRPLTPAEISARACAEHALAQEKLSAKKKVIQAWVLAHLGKAMSKALAHLPKVKPLLTLDEVEKKYKGKTRPAAGPVSWRITVSGLGKAQGPKPKVSARAQWSVEDAELITSPQSGCLAIDINAWGISWAFCKAQGNKPSRKTGQEDFSWHGDMPIHWAHTSQDQATHLVRQAAKKIVEMAARLGVPLGIELLDFAKKKANLRYESGKRAKALSGFAYAKLSEALLARAAKVGVEVLFVDPAWSSVVGWAKYGEALGLSADQAAAFCLARRAVLSRQEADEMKRVKRGKGFVELASRPEKLSGGDRAGRLVTQLQKNQETHEKTHEKTTEKHTDKKQKALKLFSNTSTKAASLRPGIVQRNDPHQGLKSSGVRLLSRALGSDRKLWPGRMRILLQSQGDSRDQGVKLASEDNRPSGLATLGSG